MKPLAAKALDSFPLHLFALMAFALVLNREGPRLPSGNELIYLCYLAKAWHPALFAHDWTFIESTAGHGVFNLCFGWLTRLAPLEIVAWAGRIICWAFCFTGLFRIGRHLGAKPWMVSAGILLWLIERQSFVSTEWIIGTFEAKCIAYASLLFAIDCILCGRFAIAGILTGIAFSIHTAVGMWAGVALGMALILSRVPVRTVVVFSIWTLLFSLPGVISNVLLVRGGASMSAEEAQFLTVYDMPFHLDPLTFGKGKIAIGFAMLSFCLMHAFTSRRDDFKAKYLATFSLSLGLIFAAGVAARISADRHPALFTFIQLFPFRVFAVMVMPLFFFHIAAAWTERKERPLPKAVVVFAIIVLLAIPSPVMRLASLAGDQIPHWWRKDDGFRAAAEWVKDNTPDTAVIICPPWRKDSFYFTHRPQVACWHAPRFDKMTEWRHRIEAMAGDLEHLDLIENLSGEMGPRAQAHYDGLSEAQINTIRQRFGGDYLVTRGNYTFKSLFNSGDYTVYILPAR